MLAIAIDESLSEVLELAGDHKQLAPLAERLIEALDAAGADPRRQALVRIRTARAGADADHEDAAAQLQAARAIADRLDGPGAGEPGRRGRGPLRARRR